MSSNIVMPDGKGGFLPCPEVLTEAEAILFLRLDKQKANAKKTLQYYREQGKLKATKIGKNLLYSKKALCAFVDKMTSNDYSGHGEQESILKRIKYPLKPPKGNLK